MAMLLVSDLPGPVQRALFVWNVSLVEPPPLPAQPPTAHPRPAKSTPVVPTALPVQQIHQPVRQEVRQHRPVLHAVVPAAEPTTRPHSETQSIQHARVVVQQEASEAASPRAVSVERPLTARPITTAVTAAAAVQSAGASLQKPAVQTGGTARAITGELVRTGDPASAVHREPVRSGPALVAREASLEAASAVYRESRRSVDHDSVVSTSASVRETGPLALYAQSASQAVIATESLSTAVEERSILTAPALARLPVMELPVRATPDTEADFGWLADQLREHMERKKRYPRLARMNGWEGKVVIRAVIRADGGLAHEAIEESSGYDALDQAALDLMKQVCPLALKHPLGQPQVVVDVPIHYRIEQ